jgi:hypothetical protein
MNTDKSLEMLDDISNLIKSTIPSGEDFGKPMARRKDESSNEFMSRIVSHLVKDKGYDQQRAVAAAYNMSGHPRAGKPVKKSLGLFITV